MDKLKDQLEEACSSKVFGMFKDKLKLSLMETCYHIEQNSSLKD